MVNLGLVAPVLLEAVLHVENEVQTFGLTNVLIDRSWVEWVWLDDVRQQNSYGLRMLCGGTMKKFGTERIG